MNRNTHRSQLNLRRYFLLLIDVYFIKLNLRKLRLLRELVKMGEMTLHGPHHVAQKSMTTTLLDSSYTMNQLRAAEVWRQNDERFA